MRMLLAVSLSLAAAGCSSAAKTPAAAGAGASIARVEAGLQKPIIITGAPEERLALAARMSHYKVPGVSVAVVEGGRIVWAKGYGLKAVGTVDSVTPKTLFQAASISKPVAATAMLRLVDEGKLALDTPVNTYLTSWQLPENKFTATEKVTLRRIASHNAGLTIHGFPGYAVTDSVPTVPQVLDGAKPANTGPVRVDTFPGAIVRYAGGGTTIEQLVMQDVTKEDFTSLMKRLVIDPIGMTNSGYEQPLSAARRGQEAVGYRSKGEPVEGKWHVYPEKAAAGLWTTPTDLLKWAMEVTAARAGKSTKVLSQKAATEMLTAQKAPFGIGPMLHGAGQEFYFEHGGANEGYRCQVVYFPELGKGAAVMTNSDAGSAVASELLFAIAKEYGWPGYGPRKVAPVAKDSAALQAYVGTYATTRPVKATVTVAQDGARLFMVEPQLIPRGDVVFVTADSGLSPETGMEFAFGRGKDGMVGTLRIGGIVLARAR